VVDAAILSDGSIAVDVTASEHDGQRPSPNDDACEPPHIEPWCDTPSRLRQGSLAYSKSLLDKEKGPF
jgi:hypothetical protein